MPQTLEEMCLRSQKRRADKQYMMQSLSSLFRKDRLFQKDRKESSVAILVMYTIPAVSHHLPGIPQNDVLTCDIGPQKSR